MKMFKSKNIRRICVLLAMLAPVVYLFGSLFSGLTGAHGTQVFADEVYETGERYEPIDNVSVTGSYRFTWFDSPSVVSEINFRGVSFVSNGIDYVGLQFYPNGELYYNLPTSGSSLARNNDGTWVNDLYKVLVFDVSSLPSSFNSLVGVGSFECLFDFDGRTDFSDYVFGQFFAKDNFLEQIGKDVLSENPHGFVPFASFWKYLDENMLHMGDMQLGLMGYGYVYYCCHVLLFDIAFILVTFFLDFIQKVNDKVVGGVD